MHAINVERKKMVMGRNTSFSSRSHLVQTLEKYALWLFALVIIVVSIILLYIGTLVISPYKDICLSVSTSLIASLLFSFVYSSVVDKQHLAAVNDQLTISVRDAVEDIKNRQQENMQQVTDLLLAKIEDLEHSHYHYINSHFADLIPLDRFPATNQPDPRFNQTLIETLETSRQYLFKGVTGRYIPSRLEAAGHHSLLCRILLIDPAREDLLQIYVRDRFGAPSSSQALSQQVQKVKEEIYMTIIDLFEQAQRTTTDVRMYHGPVYYRTEIFDDRVFVSYFTQKASTAYPDSYMYAGDSLYYEAFLTDFNQAFELAFKSINFNTRTTKEQLGDFLVSIGCDVDDISQLQQKAKEFRRNFLDKS